MFAHIGQTSDDFCLKLKWYNSNGDHPGTVQCLTYARGFKKMSKQISRCPSGHWMMLVRTPADVFWVELPPVRINMFYKNTYGIYIDISLLKTKNINTKINIWHKQLMVINMQRPSAIGTFCSLEKVRFFISITVRVSLFFFLFLWKNNGEFLYKYIHYCTKKLV